MGGELEMPTVAGKTDDRRVVVGSEAVVEMAVMRVWNRRERGYQETAASIANSTGVVGFGDSR